MSILNLQQEAAQIPPQGWDDFATQSWANIARADWERIKHMYTPVEQYLFGMVNNPQYRQQQVNQNLATFNAHNNASEGTFNRDLGRYGMSLSPDQAQSHERQMAIQRGLGQVEAVNRTKMGLQNMEYGILGAGTRPQVEPTTAPQV